MKPRWTELRFGRRLLTLFVTSALLPIVAVFALSWFQVSDQLREQSRDRLDDASKAVGLMLLGRLQAIDRDLAAFDPDLPTPDWQERRLRSQLTALAVARPGGGTDTLFGRAPSLPAPGPRTLAALAEGRPLLRVDPESRIVIVRRAAGDASGGAGPTLLLAAVDPKAMFDLSTISVVPRGASLCVFDETGRPLACDGDAAMIRAHLPEEPGPFEWSSDGEDHLADVYKLFMAGEFQAPSWQVALSEPRSAVLAPVIAFRRALPMVAMLTIVVITLLCIRQIRARLGPFEALQEGTRRVARQDFDVQIEVSSDDEFEELAESFNAMARRLQGQFRSLTTLVEIDSQILAAAEEQAVIETVLGQLPEVYPCDGVALIPFSDEPEEEATAWVARVDTGEIRRVPVPMPPLEAEGADLADAVVPLDDAEGWLGALRELGLAHAVVLPMVVQGSEIGRVALGHRDAEPTPPAERVYAERVVDQAAIALRSIRVNEQNRVLAHFDSLTGLPNRLLFRERAEQALLQAQRKGSRMAICLLDLDGFKRVNDTWGHDAGDLLLEAVAARIRPIARTGTFARLGGDEFTLLVLDLDRAEDVARITERIVEELQKPFTLGSREALITASIGIAVHPEDGEDLNTLLKHADVAMYHAKDMGRNNYQYFSEGLNEAAAARMELEQALRGALAAGQLRMVYQPIVDPVSKEAHGAEALMRWLHPELGEVPPSVFIPVAEETGLIGEIGSWALRTALAEARAWKEAGAPIYVAVNLSQRQFRDRDLTDTIRKALREEGVAPDRLVIELTESMLMSDAAETLAKLTQIRMMGARLAIDDFGTGYSSFAHLKDFPVQILKLDKSFIDEIGRNEDGVAIVNAMVALGKTLGLAVVAEGVENEDQLRHLIEQGCDLIQGFRLSQPLEAAELRGRLRIRGTSRW